MTFLRAEERAKFQANSVQDAEKAVRIVLAQYRAGTVDFTRVTQIEQNLVQLLDTLAQARGEIGLGLIQVYRALGGGWQIRLTGCETNALPPGVPQPDDTSPIQDLKPLPAPKEEKAPTSAPGAAPTAALHPSGTNPERRLGLIVARFSSAGQLFIHPPTVRGHPRAMTNATGTRVRPSNGCARASPGGAKHSTKAVHRPTPRSGS